MNLKNLTVGFLLVASLNTACGQKKQASASSSNSGQTMDSVNVPASKATVPVRISFRLHDSQDSTSLSLMESTSLKLNLLGGRNCWGDQPTSIDSLVSGNVPTIVVAVGATNCKIELLSFILSSKTYTATQNVNGTVNESTYSESLGSGSTQIPDRVKVSTETTIPSPVVLGASAIDASFRGVMLALSGDQASISNDQSATFKVKSFEAPALGNLRVTKSGSLFNASFLCLGSSSVTGKCVAGSQDQPFTSFRAKLISLPASGNLKDVAIPDSPFADGIAGTANSSNNGVLFIGLNRALSTNVDEVLLVQVSYGSGTGTNVAYKAFKVQGF